MGSNDNQTLKRLTPVVFLIATLFLVLGIFLSLIIPAQAQTPVPTMMGTVSGTMMVTTTPMMATEMPTAMATSAGVPNTGAASRTMLISSDLTNWSVVDRDGNQIGAVNGLILDMRGANVCAPAPAATSVATPTASAGGSTTSSIARCSLPGGNTGQTAGVVRFIVVDRSGASSGSSPAATAAPLATSVSGTSMPTPSSSGNLIPVPWALARFDPTNHVVIVNAVSHAFDNAPSFSSGSVPDLFTGPDATQVTTFWNTPTNLSGTPIPNTGGAGSTNQTAVPTTAAATTAATTAAATAMPTSTSASSSAAGTTVPATVAAPASGAGTPTAIVPVTGIDLGQASDAAAIQQRIILDVGIVVVGLGVLVLALIFRSGKS
jgi:hypothetical protein